MKGDADKLRAQREAHYARVTKPCRVTKLVGPPLNPISCPQCGGPLDRRGVGRPSEFCSPACKQKAYRERKAGK